MSEDARERMIRSAMYVLSREGYQGASFSAVLAHSGAPRGSIYHHFPGGKDELIAAAVAATVQMGAAALEPNRGTALPTLLSAMSGYWRGILERSDCAAGCAILATSVGATDPGVREAVAGAFAQWRAHYRLLLEESGVSRRRSGEIAALLLSGFEGAMHLARAESDLAVFDEASRTLRRCARTLADT